MLTKNQCLWSLCILLLVFIATVLLQGMRAPFSDPLEQQILLQLRLPLVLTALVVGAGLAVSSASLQVLLKNPLADPGIIGISSGASLFAAVFLLLGSAMPMVYIQYLLPLSCFVGALFSTLLIYLIARNLSASGSSVVILAGVAISTLSGAIVSWLYFFSDSQYIRNLTFWLMGSLHQADWSILALAAPLMGLLLLYMLGQGQNLNRFYFGSSAAQLAGVEIVRFNRKILLICALMVGIAVSIAGSIAFVGLLVPHLLRNFYGHDNSFILPASALLGAVLLLTVLLVSGLFGGVNVPVSMLTATLGGPVFLYSVIRLGKQGL